ncbi:MAG: ABC transporter substrate-binding protein [Acidimicrobiales bacterium]
MGVVLGAGVLTVGLGALAPASGAASSNTATWAEQPQSPPDYIFPFMSLAFFSVANVNQFQYLMYRPLYWFGQGSTPNLNPGLSLAQNPQYSDNDQTVVIKLNSYRWSNGEQVTSQDVMFWMNMLHAEKANWEAYTPGGNAIPDNIQSVTINSPTQLTFQLTKSFNPTWYTYNELSQITPLPLAWDKTTSGGVAGSGGCSIGAYGTVDTQCAAVYTFLSQQAGYNPNNPNASNTAVSTYATNPLWQVVDGPWRLTDFDASGNVTLVPNPSYSGSVKPTLKSFKELPFTSDYSEFNALVSGKVSVGYLPSQAITAATSNPLVAGPNNSQLPNFTLAPLYTWSVNYFPYNFDSNANGGTVGKIFNQLYFRQAMQYLVNQPGLIARLNDGYGVPTYGPVPVVPRNSFASAAAKSNPYPYSPSRAVHLLTAHGWRVVPNGTSTCARPGTAADECGAGIPAGARLAFHLQYAAGSSILQTTMVAERSSWAQAGINVALSSASFMSVIDEATPCPGGCGWQLENTGVGWNYDPYYYPTGEQTFQTGAASNSGDYSSLQADALINATMLTPTNLTTYQNFVSGNLPVVFQPEYATQMTEIAQGLSGVTPQNVLWQITPESWRWNG